MLDVRKIRLTLELREAGINNTKVLSAIETTPRELFIPESFRNQAYENIALPIGKDQTISQPYIVALMSQLLEINTNHKILELGTGTGYQSAILSKLARRVYTIERIKSLHVTAENNFKKLKISNIVSRHADGNLGWSEQIPFDRIIYTALTNKISNNVFDHIKENGIIVAPIIVNSSQVVKKYIKKNNKIQEEDITDVVFVPNLKGTKD